MHGAPLISEEEHGPALAARDALGVLFFTTVVSLYDAIDAGDVISGEGPLAAVARVLGVVTEHHVVVLFHVPLGGLDLVREVVDVSIDLDLIEGRRASADLQLDVRGLVRGGRDLEGEELLTVDL